MVLQKKGFLQLFYNQGENFGNLLVDGFWTPSPAPRNFVHVSYF